jgi:hypothetical protein
LKTASTPESDAPDFFLDVQVWPYAAHQVETADWHTARSGSGGSSSVLLGVSEHDLDGRAADPRIRNRREVDSSLVHVVTLQTGPLT